MSYREGHYFTAENKHNYATIQHDYTPIDYPN